MLTNECANEFTIAAAMQKLSEASAKLGEAISNICYGHEWIGIVQDAEEMVEDAAKYLKEIMEGC
jgi:hypothetical protein